MYDVAFGLRAELVLNRVMHDPLTITILYSFRHSYLLDDKTDLIYIIFFFSPFSLLSLDMRYIKLIKNCYALTLLNVI